MQHLYQESERKDKGWFLFSPPFLFFNKFFLREESIGFPLPCSVARAQLNPLHCTAGKEVQRTVCSVH